jgi:hypothetical protein
MITRCLYTLDYPGQQFATNVQNGVVGWTVTKQKLCPQMIIHQAHSGRELCRHIVKPLTLIASPDSFHSIEDDGERDGYQSTQDDMILSTVVS